MSLHPTKKAEIIEKFRTAGSAPGSTSSRSPASTSRRPTPPARSPAASSSARAASATTRSSPRASSTARAARSSPTASKRHADHRDRPLQRQAEQGRRPRPHRRERRAPHLRHPVERPDRGRPRRPQGRRAPREPDLRADLEKSDLDIVVACSRDAIVMVEGGAAEATEAEIIDALMFAHGGPARPRPHRALRAAVGKPKRPFTAPRAPRTSRARARRWPSTRARQACARPREEGPLRGLQGPQEEDARPPSPSSAPSSRSTRS
jgi:hypothetical protein